MMMCFGLLYQSLYVFTQDVCHNLFAYCGTDSALYSLAGNLFDIIVEVIRQFCRERITDYADLWITQMDKIGNGKRLKCIKRQFCAISVIEIIRDQDRRLHRFMDFAEEGWREKRSAYFTAVSA